MTPKEKMTNKELVAHNEELMARVKELEEKLALSEKSIEAMKAAPAPDTAQPSKSRVQAEQALALLKAGPVTIEQLKQVNLKYPSDPMFVIRHVLKQQVFTHRSKEGATTYSLEDQKKETTPDKA